MNIDVTYPTVYRDKDGEEGTGIHNDGAALRMTVRGVTFEGGDFDDFRPGAAMSTPLGFTLAGYHNSDIKTLCSYMIDFQMIVPVVGSDGTPRDCALNVHLELGCPDETRGGCQSEALVLSLDTPHGTIRSKGSAGWFEDDLLEIQRQLPNGVFIKACINCAFSDYSPYGHGLFGGLACFRDAKIAYQAVNTKDDLFRIWDSMTEFVQETYLCPDFQRRRYGSGYRG